MSGKTTIIRDYVAVRPHPTVVRLQDLNAPEAAWLTESFLLTPEAHNHVHPPQVVPLSLINFSAANRLEDIIGSELGIRTGPGDRRPAWDEMLAARPNGLLLLIDELSEIDAIAKRRARTP